MERCLHCCSELHPLNVETDVLVWKCLVWKCLVWNILFILSRVACCYIFARYYKLTKQYCLTSDLSCKWLESSSAIVAAVARLTIAPRLPSSSTKVFLRSILSCTCILCKSISDNCPGLPTVSTEAYPQHTEHRVLWSDSSAISPRFTVNGATRSKMQILNTVSSRENSFWFVQKPGCLVCCNVLCLALSQKGSLF